MCPQGQKHRIKPIIQKGINGQIASQGGVEFYFNPQLGDHLNVFIQYLRWQTVVRYSHPEHAACLGKGLKYGGFYALPGQMKGTGKTCRTRSDDGHSFACVRGALNFDVPGIVLVRGQSFQIPNGNGLIHLTPAAGVFTLMGADTPQDPGKGQLFHDDLQGLFVIALFHHLHIPLDIEAGRAG